jgi:hypothetical protein
MDIVWYRWYNWYYLFGYGYMLGFVTDVADMTDIIVSIDCGIIVQLLLYFDIITDNCMLFCLN